MGQLGVDMSREERHARRERRGRLAAFAAFLVVLLLLAGAVLGGRALYLRLTAGPEDYEGPGTGAVRVEVAPGDSAAAIGRSLLEAGVVASVGAFRDAAAADERAVGIQPGFYELHARMSATSALEMLLDPASRIETKVTVREGLRLGETLQTLADATDIPLADFEAAAENPAPLALPSWAGTNLEGLLFPATYTVAPDATATEVLSAMVRRFEQAANETGLLSVPGRDPLSLLTVASLVQAEAPPEAMTRVARVVYNRLAAGRPLQLDTTVDFANGKRGVTTTAADRANPSPYNTYAHAGLPPGPIDSPGAEAMAAAVEPADGPWLYFVAVDPDTGDTRFATTDAEHQTNVRLFQQWLADNPQGSG